MAAGHFFILGQHDLESHGEMCRVAGSVAIELAARAHRQQFVCNIGVCALLPEQRRVSNAFLSATDQGPSP